MNYIKDIWNDKVSGITTFFLQTDDEPDFWYWQVETADVDGNNYLTFVNDPENATLGCSVSGFATLDDARENALGEV